MLCIVVIVFEKQTRALKDPRDQPYSLHIYEATDGIFVSMYDFF